MKAKICPQCGQEMSRYDTTYKVGGWSGWQCFSGNPDHHIYDDDVDVEEVEAHRAEMRQAIQDIVDQYESGQCSSCGVEGHSSRSCLANL